MFVCRFAVSGSYDHAIYGKNPLKNVLGNHWADIDETWYVASGTQGPSLFVFALAKVDLDLFNGKVKFCNLGFSIGRSENNGFFQKLLQPLT